MGIFKAISRSSIVGYWFQSKSAAQSKTEGDESRSQESKNDVAPPQSKVIDDHLHQQDLQKQQLQLDAAPNVLLPPELSAQEEVYQDVEELDKDATVQKLHSIPYESQMSFNGQECSICTADEGIRIRQDLQSRSFIPFWGVTKNQLEIELPYQEILGAEVVAVHKGLIRRSWHCQLKIHTFKREEKGMFTGEWTPTDYILETEDEEDAREWERIIRRGISEITERPKKLLVFINPHSGIKKAKRVWTQIAEPIFQAAEVVSEVVETTHQGHAQEMVKAMDMAEIQGYDGIVGVGGDGLFQEILNGFMDRKDVQKLFTGLTVKERIRIGQIPGGSTDCLAFSVNGTRSAATAALHIVVGDRMPLDVMKVESKGQERRHVVCLASYGFLGDVMRRSEFYRILGPTRYDVAGFFTYLSGQSYKVKIEYQPFEMPGHRLKKSRCHSRCTLCNSGSFSSSSQPLSRENSSGDLVYLNHHHHHHHHRSLSFSNSITERPPDWKVLEGEYKMVMCAVTSCMSDKSKTGLMPYAHTSDGRMHLILVSKINFLSFLFFLSSMSKRGIDEEAFNFVDTIDVKAFRMTPVGRESSWNIDGELMKDNHIYAKVEQGLVDVFARGVEVKQDENSENVYL